MTGSLVIGCFSATGHTAYLAQWVEERVRRIVGSDIVGCFTVLAAQRGMLWGNLDLPGAEDPLGRNRLGTQLGLAAQASSGHPSPSDRLTAGHLGQWAAQFLLRLGRP